MNTRLPALRAGDRVAVVAPSGPVDGARLSAGLEALRRLGLVPWPGRHVTDVDGYLAGRDADRAADLLEAFADPGTRAVLVARGGFGLTRLLPALPLSEWSRTDKLLLGYSDATALALALSRARPFPWLHGPHVVEMGDERPDFDLASLRAGLFGGHPGGRQTVSGLSELRPGRAEGIVLGGCLSLIVALLGTPFECPFAGRILFIEEVNEEPYRLDRMLTHLRTSGRLNGLAGMVFGQMSGCEPKVAGRPSKNAAEVLAELAVALDVPCMSGLRAGHGPGRMTIPLGVRARLDTGAGEIEFRHS